MLRDLVRASQKSAIVYSWRDKEGTSTGSFAAHISKALPAPELAQAMRLAPKDAHHVVLTYSHALDLALCDAGLSHGFTRFGLIGSHTKWARFRSRLQQAGHARTEIERIRCPIGDKTLGKHPAVIALGVAAQIASDVALGSRMTGQLGDRDEHAVSGA